MNCCEILKHFIVKLSTVINLFNFSNVYKLLLISLHAYLIYFINITCINLKYTLQQITICNNFDNLKQKTRQIKLVALNLLILQFNKSIFYT